MAAHVISDALAGLHYAHQLRDFDGTPLAIVHRDLSPPNIFVTYDGIVKVVDFGVAKTALASRTKTDTGTFKGKISYMAPEQAMHEDVDHRADIFSMGAVLWELLAGKRLFREISPALTLKRILHDEVPLLSSARPGIDPALDAIVKRALQRNPNERYASALQMRQDLERFLRSGEATNWDAELGALVSEKFAKQRQKVQRQVQLCMNEESERRGELPKVNLTDTASGVSASSEGRVSGDVRTAAPAPATETGSGPGVFRFELDAPTSVAPPLLPERRRVGIAVLLAALAAGALIAGWIAFSAEDGAALEAARAQTASTLSASLEILSTPPGAVIFVDGEPSGLFTPAVLKGLPTGRSVLLRIDKAGYQAQEERVSLANGQALKRSFRLLESEGLIRFVGAPADARVYVDEGVVAEGTVGPIAIPVGSHKIRVETASALVFSQVIQVVPGEQTIQVAATRSAQ